MVDFYDDSAIDYFEEEDDLDSFDAAFMRGYVDAGYTTVDDCQ